MLLITWEQQKLIVRKREDKSAQTLCHCFMWCICPSTKRMHDRMIIWLYPSVCLSRSHDCQRHNSCLLSLSVGILLLSTGSQEYEVLRCQLKLSRDDKDDNMTSCVMARWHGNQLCQCYIPPDDTVATSQCSDWFKRYFQYFVYGFNIRVVKQLSHISSILLKYFIIILVLEIVTWAYNLKDKTAIKFM